MACFQWKTGQVQICVGSSFGVFSVGNLAGANLCRVFVWGVFWGEPSRCKLNRGSSFGVFSVENLAGANLCRVFVWGVFWGEPGRCQNLASRLCKGESQHLSAYFTN